MQQSCDGPPCAESALRQQCPNRMPLNDLRHAHHQRGLDLPSRRKALRTAYRGCLLMISQLPGIDDPPKNESLIKLQRQPISTMSDRTRLAAFSLQVLWTPLLRPWSESGCLSTSAVASLSVWATPRIVGKARTQMRYQPTSPTVVYGTNDGYGLRRMRALLCGAASNLRAVPPCWARVDESVSIPVSL